MKTLRSLALGLALIAAPAARAQDAAPEPPSATAQHVHGPGCGHYFHDGAWQDFPSAHVHSAACGHAFYDGAWHLFPQGHEHSATCGHFFYGGAWHAVAEGHTHGIACGHEFVDGEWRDAAPSADTESTPAAAPGPEAAAPAPAERPIALAAGVVEPMPPPTPRLQPIKIVYQQDPRVYVLSGARVIVATDEPVIRHVPRRRVVVSPPPCAIDACPAPIVCER